MGVGDPFPAAESVFVKICGTTNLQDARLSVAAGANALGFIFAPSKRRVTPDEAARITEALPPEVLRVGVFTTGDSAEILDAAERAGLNAVQLHMPYEPGRVSALHAAGVLLIQVVAVEADAQRLQADAGLRDRLLRELTQAFTDRRLWAVLLDAASAGTSGGLGRSFGWRHVLPLLQEARRQAEAQGSADKSALPKVLLAGGLTPANVTEALETLQPWGVDVVSGVERLPGRKDPDSLRLFVSNARQGKTR